MNTLTCICVVLCGSLALAASIPVNPEKVEASNVAAVEAVTELAPESLVPAESHWRRGHGGFGGYGGYGGYGGGYGGYGGYGRGYGGYGGYGGGYGGGFGGGFIGGGFVGGGLGGFGYGR